MNIKSLVGIVVVALLAPAIACGGGAPKGIVKVESSKVVGLESLLPKVEAKLQSCYDKALGKNADVAGRYVFSLSECPACTFNLKEDTVGDSTLKVCLGTGLPVLASKAVTEAVMGQGAKPPFVFEAEVSFSPSGD